MHACMHGCMHACMHPCIHASMHPCIHASMHPCIHASMHPCMLTNIHIDGRGLGECGVAGRVWVVGEWVSGCVGGWMGGWVAGCGLEVTGSGLAGWVVACVHGWMVNGWTALWMCSDASLCLFACLLVCGSVYLSRTLSRGRSSLCQSTTLLTRTAGIDDDDNTRCRWGTSSF